MADHTTADQGPEPTAAPNALDLWNALVQEQLDDGLGQLAATEAVNRAYPNLWGQATAEATAQRRRAQGRR